MMEKDQVRFSQRLLSSVLSVLLATQPLLPAVAATITPTGNTQMDKAANGVPVVNIATPNQAGISHNKYNDYNVGKEGLILNNATGQFNQTQLGGIIQNNPNLRPGKEATGVINEVTGANRSQLQGYTEVAGKAANVMVANPYGISCNGCGFINTPNATLTTGKPVLDANGNLQSLDVSKGSITIEGKGLDGSQSDAVSIIARATEINAALHAKDLNVITGTNRVAADGQVSQLKGEGEIPKIAVDTGALGGMYANRIRLVSSEKGLGVNLGNLNTRQGDITLDANGKLTVKSSLASGAISAKGQEVVLSGDHKAGGNLSVASQGGITLNDSQLVSDKNLQLSAQGKLAQNGGKLTAGQDIALMAGTLTQQRLAQVDAAGNISLTGRESVTTQGNFTAGKQLNVAGNTLSNSGQWSAGGAANIKGGSLTNSGVMQGKSLDINADRNVDLNGQINAADALTVKGKQIVTASGAQVQSGQGLTLTAESATLKGTHAAKKDFTVTADTLTHNGKSNAERIALSATKNLTNNGTLLADSLRLESQHIANSGLMQGDAALNVNAGKLDNLRGGSLYSQASLALDIPSLTNYGLITTEDSLRLNGSQLVNGGEINGVHLQSGYVTVKNEAAGRLLADKSLSITGQRTDNAGLLAADKLELNSQKVSNSGNVLAVSDLTLKNQTLDNVGLLQGNTLNIQANQWQNSGNALGEAGVTADVGGAFTNQGNVLSQQNMTVDAASITNSGMLAAKVLALRGDLNNSGILQGNQTLSWDGNHFNNLANGQATSGESLLLNGTRFENDGQIEGHRAAITADSLRNGGDIQAQENLTVAVNGRLDNQGTLRSQNLFELAAAQLFNDNTLVAKSLSLNTPELTNNGIVQGNSALQLTTRNLLNGKQGQMIGGAGLDLRLDTLENHGLLLTRSDFTLNGRQLINTGDIQAESLDLKLDDAINNQGNLLAKNVTLDGKSIRNSGLVQGNDSVSVSTETLTTDAAGKWLTANALTVDAGVVGNAGVMQGDSIALTASALNNSGVLNAQQRLDGVLSGALTNQGHIQSGGALSLTADGITSAGRIVGDRLTLSATTLNNNGLWQGANGLSLSGDVLTTGTASRTLSGGALTVEVGDITTQGTLQGQQVTVTADDWLHKGSLVSLGKLTADISNSLNTSGELMSQGAMSLAAPQFDNSGKLLSESDVTLDGQQLINSGEVQGNTLAIHQSRINNQGALIGLQSLTVEARQNLMTRIAMAAPQLELVNAAGGSLLTQGALKVTSGDVTNAGVWQGQSILLNAQSLTHSGAIQSADALQLTLANQFASSEGSKVTALGNATLQALSLTNKGQWAAKNLTLKGATLDNAGAISGVNGLTLAINDVVRQQTPGSMLTGGVLDLNAASVANDGSIQGATLNVASGTLTNNGRLQGDNGAALTLSGDLINNAGGEIVSRQGLTVTTPVLFNYGLMQGGGDTNVNATTRALNDGKLLSGAEMTLTTPHYSGAGWLQATNLILNAETATNGGNWLADRAMLTGATFTNQGTTQAGQLTVNYNQLTNNGTLLGTERLAISASQVTQSTTGKLFSGGDLSVQSRGLDALGQVVALGNLTLKLANAFTAKSTLAAGKTLSVSSEGAIDNRSVIQGLSVNLTAGGQLSNNGQITTGNGASNLSGSLVALNAAGTLQGGGDITITSRSNINVDGFTGTRGSLTLDAPGAIINTALLYAANNLALYANSITNQRGDILAGNNLWMQKDAQGNANSEVVNTSGNIETQNGDITIKTGHLLNQRDGLVVSNGETEDLTQQYSWLNEGYADIPLSELILGTDYGYVVNQSCSGGGSPGHGASPTCRDIATPRPMKDSPAKEIAISRSTLSVSAEGGAGRISSARGMVIQAGHLENNASSLLAGGDMRLSGATLQNQSWTDGTITRYRTYVADRQGNTWQTPVASVEADSYRNNPIHYIVQGNDREEATGATVYRSVIQSGGNITAQFTQDISNTNTTPDTSGVISTLITPTLNTLSNQTISSGLQKQTLIDSGTVNVNSPQWNDQLQNALQQINGGGALDSESVSDATLTNTEQKGSANLGELNGLTTPGAKGVDVAGQNQGKTVDVSAYPLPSGQNGYFVVSDDPKSPYLINVNPKLNGLGQLDPALFGDLNALLGIKPGDAPRETDSAYTDQNQFLGSAYMLDRLNLNPEYDYRFLGDAAFDTRYVSNAMLNQTGSRYINGIGSDLDQMRYLMDHAASAQQSLGLRFGVALTAEQIASLDNSMLWWEAASVNGETVMIPKLYLSPKDVTVNNGSVISGNNVQLASGNITNSGSSILANNNLTLDSQNSINNLNNSLMQAGGNLDLSAIGDINNISATISGKTVQLTSLDGSINNLTLAEQIDINAKGRYDSVSIKDTLLGTTASITAQDGLSLSAGKNITVTGANLSAGDSLLMNAWGDIAVNANQVNDAFSQSGKWKPDTSRESVGWQGSSISAGGNLGIHAGNNLNVTASDVNAGGSAALTAGNDLNLNAASTRENSRNGGSESHSTGLERTTVSAGDNLVLKAGQDLNAHAAGLAAENDVGLQAGRDINLLAEATTDGDSYRAKKKTVINESVRQQGTEIASGGDTVILAGRDVNAQATDVIAQGDIGVAAGRDVNLITATESDYRYQEKTKTSSGFLSKKTTHTIEENSATREKGALLSGDNVAVKAGNNLLVQGSAIAGDGNVALDAGNNVDIVAATNTDTSWRFKETKKSGLMGTGGIGFTIGSSKTTHDLREQGTTQSESFSTVGSTGGNVSITAGQQAHIGGADIIAQNDIVVGGDSVVIEPGHDKRTRDETFEQKSSGLTVALSGAAGSALNSAVQTAKDVKNESDDRLAALQATKAALSGVQAGQGVDVAQASGDPSNGFGVSVSLTSQKSKSEQHTQSDTVTGSTLNAGNNLVIAATGNGQSENSGDILIGGSQLKAGGDTTLAAANDIVLSGAANTQQTTGKNSSSGGGVGVGIGVNSGGYGISVFANVNAAKGHEKGNGTAWTETTLDSGGTVSMTSGRDAILNGAQVSGDSVVADIGRDLWMSSGQDSNDYNSTQNSAAAGGSFTFGSMTGSGYISASQDKMKSEYDSVQEQTGLFAGDGGFDVTVGRHTQLDGAVIASTATADKNSLDTGTLGFSDIHNEADYRVSHTGVSLSGGGDFGGDTFKGNMPGGMISAAGNSGHAEGTTQAAVSDGAITVRDTAKQQQDVASLSRDTEHANDSISPIFDKEKEQKRLQEVSIISEIGSQAADIARTRGELNALEEARKVYPDKTVEELKETQTWRDAQAKNGTGSDIQRGIQAATAALQGLAGGDIGGALAGASAPELANIIGHKSGLSDEAALIAHAILGGAAAAMQGNSVAAGAAGAASGELAAKAIMSAMYPGKSVSELSESEKQTISTLATISAGMAGGLAGDSTAGAAAGGQAGKNAVENNSLAHVLAAAEANKAGTAEKWQEEQQAAIKEACSGDTPVSCQMAVAAMGTVMSGGLLPEAMVISGAISAGAVGGIDYAMNGSLDPKNVIAAYWVGALTRSTGLEATIAINAAGGATTSYLDGKNPWVGGLVSGLTGGVAYGVGNKVVEPAMDKVFNPVWKNLGWDDIGMGISKPVQPSLWPSVAGTTSGTSGGEYISNKVNDKIDEAKSNIGGNNK